MTEFIITPLAGLIIGVLLFAAGLAILVTSWLKLNPTKQQPLLNTNADSFGNSSFQNDRLIFAAKKTIGDRSYQQDAIMMPGDDITVFDIRSRGCLCILCDGMGGMEGGEKASQTCAKVIFDDFYEENNSLLPPDFFRLSINKADHIVANLVSMDGEKNSAGTTFTGALICSNRLYWATVGDSRIYFWHQGQFTQLSQDHNYLQELLLKVNKGEIELEEAITNPHKEALTQYIGKGIKDSADISQEGELFEKGDIVILCSDGLYRALDDGEIATLISNFHDKPALIPDLLITAALQKDWMTHDNISVVIISNNS